MKILLALFFLTLTGATAFADAINSADLLKFRNTAFESIKIPKCIQLSRGQTSPSIDNLGIVDTFKKIAFAIQTKKTSELVPLMHSKLNATQPKLQRMLDELGYIYQEPLSVSLYRVWALNTPDTKATPLPCFEDELAIGPHYGYELQFGGWLQVSGSKDIARLYISLVPAPEGWRIGAWFAQQWTFLGKDPDQLISEGLAAKAKNDKLMAFALLDLSAKLLDGGGYVYLARREDVLTTRDAFIPNKEVVDIFSKQLKSLKLVSVGTIFAPEGPGWIFRFLVPRETKVNDLEPACFQELASIFSKTSLDSYGSARCSFVVPGETISKDGGFGSLLVRKDKILGLLKKKS